MQMATARQVLRLALVVTGGIVLLQVPIFLLILNTARLSTNSRCPEAHSRTDCSWSLSRNSSSSSAYPSASIYPSADADIEVFSQQLDLKPGFKPLSAASYPFVLFSTYRHTLESIYVLGITSVIWRQYEHDRPVYKCEWLPSNGLHIVPSGRIITEAQMMYIRFDENGMSYVPAIVNCTFNQSVGANGLGGLLFLHVSNGPDVWGHLHVVEFVFKEEPGEVERVMAVDELQVTNSIAFCGPPVYGDPNMPWIEQWLAYHHYLWHGRAHFYFYDVGGLNATALERWIRAGVLTIVDASRGDSYAGWYRNQLLFLNDCVYRTRFSARWTFLFDLDELLHVPAPNTIDSLLEQNQDAPWMTFANLPFKMNYCPWPSPGRSSEEAWFMERMMWHEKVPECWRKELDPWLCLSCTGRRKYVVNPRKVFLAGVHKAGLPETGGVNFSGHIARVHHLRGILDTRNRPCDNFAVPGEGPDEYNFDDSIGLLVPKIKEFAGPFLNSS